MRKRQNQIPKERVRLLELWEEIGRDLEINPHKLAGTYVMLGYDWGY